MMVPTHIQPAERVINLIDYLSQYDYANDYINTLKQQPDLHFIYGKYVYLPEGATNDDLLDIASLIWHGTCTYSRSIEQLYALHTPEYEHTHALLKQAVWLYKHVCKSNNIDPAKSGWPRKK